ncbi:MAG: hypothetical protein JXL81_06205 [Deltaproteobacteria bacterium]|nr:hypothetical protein [Deltaproteobacteria bacterium]
MNNCYSQTNSREILWRYAWVIIFAMAFAWVESAVVVYLREIFYEGFDIFPLSINWGEDGRYVGNYLTRIELIREFATLVMLASTGLAAGRTGWQKFCFFMIAFGVWDIFYYVWLWVMIGWPEGLMTWDILFLLPLPWVGPVITPVLIAAAMTAAGVLIIYLEKKGYTIKFYWYDWVIVMGCGFLMIVAFCWDWKNIVQLPGDPDRTGIPNRFLWGLYLPAYLVSVFYFFLRLKKSINKKD